MYSFASRPARGGWIEISKLRQARLQNPSRPARGGWIEMMMAALNEPSRSMSRPARGGWIEIVYTNPNSVFRGSRPARGGWIEMQKTDEQKEAAKGPAPQGAGGLKSNERRSPALASGVPPRKGRVD